MHAMTEAEFFADVGRGNDPKLVVDTLVTFLRSHDYHDVAATAARLEDRYTAPHWWDECGEADDEEDPEVSDGGGI